VQHATILIRCWDQVFQVYTRANLRRQNNRKQYQSWRHSRPVCRHVAAVDAGCLPAAVRPDRYLVWRAARAAGPGSSMTSREPAVDWWRSRLTTMMIGLRSAVAAGAERRPDGRADSISRCLSNCLCLRLQPPCYHCVTTSDIASLVQHTRCSQLRNCTRPLCPAFLLNTQTNTVCVYIRSFILSGHWFNSPLQSFWHSDEVAVTTEHLSSVTYTLFTVNLFRVYFRRYGILFSLLQGKW